MAKSNGTTKQSQISVLGIHCWHLKSRRETKSDFIQKIDDKDIIFSNTKFVALTCHKVRHKRRCDGTKPRQCDLGFRYVGCI